MIRNNLYIFICFNISLFLSLQIQAQTCSADFTVKTEITNSTCMSNGQIKVTLEGNTANIFNEQYGLTSSSGFTILPQSSNILTGVPPGTYSLTVRAFCEIDNEYSVVKTVSNLVVGGTYVSPTVSFNATASRKSYAECATGVIALNVTNGSKNFTFKITSAPAGVTTPSMVVPTVNGNIYTFPGANYPAGDYTVQVDDGCYTAIFSFTLASITGFPSLKYATLYVDPTGCSRILYDTNVENLNADYAKYINARMYEIGVAIEGEVPTNWTDWANTGINARTTLDISPYTYSDFTLTNKPIFIHTRLKGCDNVSKNEKRYLIAQGVGYETYSKECYTYTGRVSVASTKQAFLCYPLDFKVTNATTGEVLFHDTNWQYSETRTEFVTAPYGDNMNAVITDINGVKLERLITPPTYFLNVGYLPNQTFCDGYHIQYNHNDAILNCKPVDIEIIDNTTGAIVYTETYEGEMKIPDYLFEYDKQYTIKAIYPNGKSYTAGIRQASKYITEYNLYINNADICNVNMGQISFGSATGGYSQYAPIGTVFTVTGPPGYTTQTMTTNYTTVFGYSMPKAYLPEGTYTLTADHGCGDLITTTAELRGAINFKDLAYTSELTCSGLKITPSGTVTLYGNNTTTFFRLTSGPIGHSKDVIAPGGSFILSEPGDYELGIQYNNGAGTCAIGAITVRYEISSLNIDVNRTAAYVCVGETVANIFVKAINGVAPYIYELWDESRTTKISEVSDVLGNDVAHFAHGAVGDVYQIQMKDACGSSFWQEVTVQNLQTMNIVYADETQVCSENDIKLHCISLGDIEYSWTGPNGFTSNEQHPVISDLNEGMTGWYYVSLMPEYCGQPKMDSIYITVIPSLTTDPCFLHQNIDVCVREAVLLTADVTGGKGVYNYQWQESTDGGTTWTHVAGATGATYTPSVIKSGIYHYRRETSDTGCGTVYNTFVLNVNPCYIPVNNSVKPHR